MTPITFGRLCYPKSVDKVLGTSLPGERKYLKALAETYENASSWDTKQQTLSIMADLLTNHELQNYIPDITEYRFKIARMHIKRYGRGAPVPENKSPRMRIDESQLDHFLSFITSSHVVETPNVIRTMIPKRIIKQYTQFCKENDVKPLSGSTIYRILSVCGATVRKSLQGLDYFAAEGGKAFDDLAGVVDRLAVHGADSNWVSYCKIALKNGKSYIKSDYKVGFVNRIESNLINIHALKTTKVLLFCYITL